ncbi:hypothetical protein MKW98_019595 [Papaver atlanticum]|uniref:Flavin-containing monooxygenase n=1 Tax=Papaver atlanticum TaxID=357466 RepID=A0AAD4S8K7_9MAGN|nr:hypothetical protein MKW98_019595 [Papaver atlanticum]
MVKEEVVIIVGAGPSGISTSACLNHLSIPNIVLERDDCLASLWTKKCYDRLHLHVAKQFSNFPHMPVPADYPKYMSKDQFVQYVDNYARQFNVKPMYNRLVELATFDDTIKKWYVKVRNMQQGTQYDFDEYVCKFLVVATGQNTDVHIPEIEGLDTFPGEVLHSTNYKSAAKYANKHVLVLGSGNSGIDIALDLANFGARTSITVRNPVHILNKEILNIGLIMIKHIPLKIVDVVLAILSKLIVGDTTKYGIPRPNRNPFSSKWIIDSGTLNKIKSGHIQVLPALKSILGDYIEFVNGESYQFDVLVLATGFRRSASKWLQDSDYLLNENGNLQRSEFHNSWVSKTKFANNWKGNNGLYCVGLCGRGIEPASIESVKIANDINFLLQNE